MKEQQITMVRTGGESDEEYYKTLEADKERTLSGMNAHQPKHHNKAKQKRKKKTKPTHRR